MSTTTLTAAEQRALPTAALDILNAIAEQRALLAAALDILHAAVAGAADSDISKKLRLETEDKWAVVKVYLKQHNSLRPGYENCDAWDHVSIRFRHQEFDGVTYDFETSTGWESSVLAASDEPLSATVKLLFNKARAVFGPQIARAYERYDADC